MRKKIKKIVYGLVYILIISGILGYFVYLIVLPMPYYYPSNYGSNRIRIIKDDDFLKYGFPGSGMQWDPYIIEDYTILTSVEHAIYIYGVSKYVIIRNNFLHSEGSVIEINSVDSNRIKIINNTCVGSIYSTWSKHIGINIDNTDGCYIYNNTCLNLPKGIRIGSSTNCLIINNHLKNNGCNIEIYSSINVNIENNSLVVYEQVEGYYYHDSLFIYYSKDISIKKNTFENSGLRLVDTNVSSLIVQDNLVNGFELGYFIDENNLEINSSSLFGQLFFINCNNSIIKNQEINASNYGIFLSNCLNFNISFCNCNNNYRIGISLANSKNITITNSTFSNNRYGTYVSYSDTIFVLNNTFTNNMYGIYSYNSDCTYNQNYFFNNTYDVYTS